jgi:uncharacterized spore protein YtfJ
LYYQFGEGGTEMSEKFNEVVVTAVKNQEQAAELMEKLLAVAQPDAVYGEPVTVGEHTVITASEVSVSMGFGYGIGGETGPESAEGEAVSEDKPQSEKDDSRGFGGGGGGGGVSMGRPVAVISIGPEGVEVEPVVDATKIALAVFTTAGSMVIMLGKMLKASRG